MAKAFISYHRLSLETAKRLASDLEAMGHEVWLDQALAGGESWWTRILAMVRGCDLFVLVLDAESLDSTACGREFEYARDLGKPIMPVLAGDGVSMNLLPAALAEIQFVDYRAHDREAVLRLARALSKMPPPPPLPDPLPDPPQAPVSFLNTLTARVDKTSTLTYEDQTALLVDLRHALRDRTIRGDAVTLLRRLRKRRDLLASVAEEIDETLTLEAKPDAAAAPAVGSPPVAHQRSPRAARATQTAPVVSSTSQARPFDPNDAPRPRTGWRARLTMAAIAGVIGPVGAAIAEGAYYGTSNPSLVLLVLVGVACVLAGAIAGFRLRPILVALALAVPAFLVAWLIGEVNDEPDALILAAVLGAAPALLVGAVIGALRDRRLRRLSRLAS